MINVGLIGIGKMGLPIGVNLIERGFQVTGFRRSGSPELAAAGGVVAHSPAAVAAASDVIISILPDAEAVEEVILGRDGTQTALRPNAVHVEMSTIDVDRKAKIREAVRARGGELLDAPISGSPGMVAPRLATTFVSGDAGAAERARPVLESISGGWVFTGSFGTGTRTKYIANLLLAAHTAAAAEAYALARAWDLDLDMLQETIEGGIGGSAIWRQRGPLMSARSWLPAPGPIATLGEILDQIEETAADAPVNLPVFGATKETFDRARRLGWSHLDIAAVHDLAAGVDALAGDVPGDAADDAAGDAADGADSERHQDAFGDNQRGAT